MFTVFDALILFALVGGGCLGARLGYGAFGTIGGLIGAVGGGVIGVVVGRIPFLLGLYVLARDLDAKSTPELKAFLRSSECLTPNCVLLELQRRGEDIREELPVVLDLLVSDDFSRRGFGWAALTSAFPELAGKIGDYRIGDSVEDCVKKTEVLRRG